MRILLIEDDSSLAELLVYGLEEEGFAVDLCPDGVEGLTLALQNLHDLILLDRMLPGLPGEELLKRIRRSKVDTPVIFITAIGDAAEKINGLDLGADDYLVKPFEIGELLARIRSVMRRTLNRPAPFYLAFCCPKKKPNFSLICCAIQTRSSHAGKLLAMSGGRIRK